jgi:ABC-type transport system involved in cytochrome c biogenesis permease subunit
MARGYVEAGAISGADQLQLYRLSDSRPARRTAPFALVTCRCVDVAKSILCHHMADSSFEISAFPFPFSTLKASLLTAVIALVGKTLVVKQEDEAKISEIFWFTVVSHRLKMEGLQESRSVGSRCIFVAEVG